MRDYEMKLYQLEDKLKNTEDKNSLQKKEIDNLQKEKSKHLHVIQEQEKLKQRILLLENENSKLFEALKREKSII